MEGSEDLFFSVFCFFACQEASLLTPLKPNFTHYMEIHSASSLFYSLTYPLNKKNKVIKIYFLYHPYFVLGLATFSWSNSQDRNMRRILYGEFI